VAVYTIPKGERQHWNGTKLYKWRSLLELYASVSLNIWYYNLYVPVSVIVVWHTRSFPKESDQFSG